MRWLSAIFVPLFMLVSVTAQDADLQVSQTVIDYGNIREGLPVVKTIILTNRGSQSVTIAKAAAS